MMVFKAKKIARVFYLCYIVSEGQQHPSTRQIKFSIGKHSIATSEQGNAADKATGESLDANSKKMMRL
jgi:hypothetical protein